MLREQWDMPMLAAMCEHWREFPPVHELVRMAIGYEPPARHAGPTEYLPYDQAAADRIRAETEALIPQHLRNLTAAAAEQGTGNPP